MAKRKNAAALFEVIHTDSRFPKRHATGFRWPLSAPRWFRRAPKSDDAPTPVQTIDYATPDLPHGPSLFTRLRGWLVSLIPPMPRFGINLDPERQTARFQLSYTAAVIIVFAILSAIALAFLAGRETTHRPRPALAEAPTDELRNGPANPEVLDIGDGQAPLALASENVPSSPSRAAPSTNTPADAPARRGANDRPLATPSSWTQPAGPTTLVVSDSRRTVGLTYVIIQSYPPEERQMADDAVKLLNGNGVLCTTETGLPYAPRWISVVGITGFDRIRDSREYDQYIARIQQISEGMAGTSKFKRFDAKPFRWKDAKGS
jgi:hypothetical protein